MIDLYNESYVNEEIYARGFSNIASFFTPVAQGENRELWDKNQYDQALTNFNRNMFIITLPATLCLIGSIAMIVSGIVLGLLPLTFLGAIGCLGILYCCFPVCDCVGTNCVIRPILNQVQLRTRLIWNEGFNQQNWPPHRGEVPAIIITMPLATQNEVFERYKQPATVPLSPQVADVHAKVALLQMVTGNWEHHAVQEFRQRLNQQPGN